MNRAFESFELTILDEVFTVNGMTLPQTARIILKDKNQKEIETVLLGHVTPQIVSKRIEKTSSIDFDNCFIENLNLSDYKRSMSIGTEELILFNNLSLKNSFLYNSEIELDLSHIGIMGDSASFENTIFIAPSITFQDSKFHSGRVSFEHALFKSLMVNFKGIDVKDTSISFKNAIFSEGNVLFSGSKFLGRQTVFTNVEFSSGLVDFSGCVFNSNEILFDVVRFGNGKKNFSDVDFGNGNKIFDKAEFHCGDVLFRNVRFGNGMLSMARVDFGDGNVDFASAEFGKGDITFTGTDFGHGKTNFKHVNFGEGLIDFHFAHFGEGDIVFDRAKFVEGGIDFRAVDFGAGRVSFNRVNFGIGDIIFEASRLEKGTIELKKCDFGLGKINFDSVEFENSTLSFDDVDFGHGLVSFRRAKIGMLTLRSCQINNFFDLRLFYCGKLDLSGTIIKDVIDLHPHDYNPDIRALELAGIRLLGRIYIDWHQVKLKDLIHQQQKGYRAKAEQFRLLKENFNAIGHYDEEDLAYVEFKRTYAKTALLENIAERPKRKLFYYINYYSQWLVFDFMGHYATNPIRVLKSTLYVFLLFSLLYYLIPMFTSSDIHSSLFELDDPRQLGPISKALYHSVITFFTIGYGDYYPDGFMRILSGVEGFIGMFMMSYFTVAFVRKILR
jgi:hypothetical protein